MNKRKQTLLAAVSSTVCAAIWLANCVVDVLVPVDALRQDVLLTAVWAACAAFWWIRWRSERRLPG